MGPMKKCEEKKKYKAKYNKGLEENNPNVRKPDFRHEKTS
jgi:hypothetical protein